MRCACAKPWRPAWTGWCVRRSKRPRSARRPARGILVTPGVRSARRAKGDQKRVATPAEAIRDGANYLVIGRQITRAADPAAEAARVGVEIAEAVRAVECP